MTEPQPGTDAAFASGMIRWIVDNQRLNVPFLANDQTEADYARLCKAIKKGELEAVRGV